MTSVEQKVTARFFTGRALFIQMCVGVRARKKCSVPSLTPSQLCSFFSAILIPSEGRESKIDHTLLSLPGGSSTFNLMCIIQHSRRGHVGIECE